MKTYLVLTALIISGFAFADSMADLARRAQNAANVLDKSSSIPDQAIPKNLIAKASCVGTFPKVIRAGFVFGGSYGEGLISCRVGDSWSRPSYFKLIGGSWGLQIGADSTDLVLVFVNPDAIHKITKSKLTLGADLSVAAGPIGREASMGTDATLQSEIYSYSRTRGLYAGLTLEGSVLSVDKDSNMKLYGDDAVALSILAATYNTAPAVVWPYIEALINYTK